MYGDANYGVTVQAGSTTASVSFGPGARGRTWTVSQVSVSMPTAPVGATCALYKAGVFVSWLLPTGDVAGNGPPLRLDGLEQLTVTWAAVTAGANGTVFVIYDDGR